MPCPQAPPVRPHAGNSLAPGLWEKGTAWLAPTRGAQAVTAATIPCSSQGQLTNSYRQCWAFRGEGTGHRCYCPPAPVPSSHKTHLLSPIWTRCHPWLPASLLAQHVGDSEGVTSLGESLLKVRVIKKKKKKSSHPCLESRHGHLQASTAPCWMPWQHACVPPQKVQCTPQVVQQHGQSQM